jgi:hypothetical protein
VQDQPEATPDLPATPLRPLSLEDVRTRITKPFINIRYVCSSSHLKFPLSLDLHRHAISRSPDRVTYPRAYECNFTEASETWFALDD